MRALRKLLLGETRVLPAGIAAIASGAVALDAVAGGWWPEVGGFVVLAATVALIGRGVALSAPRAERRR